MKLEGGNGRELYAATVPGIGMVWYANLYCETENRTDLHIWNFLILYSTYLYTRLGHAIHVGVSEAIHYQLQFSISSTHHTHYSRKRCLCQMQIYTLVPLGKQKQQCKHTLSQSRMVVSSYIQDGMFFVYISHPQPPLSSSFIYDVVLLTYHAGFVPMYNVPG